MDQAAAGHIEQMIKDEVAKRFPGAPVQQVQLLQYGDEPVIEPGELLVRVTIESAEGKDGRREALDVFERGHRGAIEKFRDDLSLRLPEARRLEFRTTGDAGRGPRIQLGRAGRGPEARAEAGTDLTPVMARLGPVDLETLDTLIKAGIAPSRAEVVRWALARIRERPAYAQLVDRAREIEELKAQF
jgi:hypothetical protein